MSTEAREKWHTELKKILDIDTIDHRTVNQLLNKLRDLKDDRRKKLDRNSVSITPKGSKTLKGKASDDNEKEIARNTVELALQGGGVERTTWENIFNLLGLDREEFFSEVEWDKKQNRETLWRNLWELAEDGEDRFGMVLPQRMQDSGCGDVFRTNGYQKTLTSGSSILLEIPVGWSGYLILVEQDPVGNIELVSPSCVSTDRKLTGDVRRLLPKHPDLKFFKPTTLGTNSLWAGIFAELPNWEWLAHVPDNGLLRLESDQLNDLLNYAKNKPEGSQIWRSSYVVVAP